jgi:GxxExxY protein
MEKYKSTNMKLNDISGQIISASIEVHKQLGPGLLESAYQKCLLYELKQIGLQVEKEVPRSLSDLYAKSLFLLN